MKVILQTKHVNLRNHQCIYVRAFLYTHLHTFHVENAVKDLQTIEVEEAEPEYQEPPEEEYEVIDQDFTNFESQPGKPRCMLTQCLHKFQFYAILYLKLCIKFIGVVLIPSCMR